MADIEHHLKSIASNAEPTTTQKNGAKRSHTYLREILKTGQMSKRIVGDYLSGSYARDTAVQPLD
jgi:tRNA nucleotidyltransferase (CCA-adding enzyme)